MPRLRETKVKGVALVKSPANRRPFLLTKSQDGAQMTEATLNMPSAAVASAIEEALAKSSVAASDRDTLAAVAHLVHNMGGVKLEDIVGVAKAAGAAEDLEKAKDKKMPSFIQEKIDAKDAEDEDEDEEDSDEDGDEDKKTKKSASAGINKGAAMQASAESVAIAKQMNQLKAENEAMRAQLVKACKDLDEEREVRLTKAIKDEVTAAYPSLTIDKDQLAGIVKSMRQAEDKSQHDALMGLLKAMETQAAAVKQQGLSLTKAVSVRGGFAAPGTAKEAQDRLVREHIAKAGKPMTYHEGFTSLMNTPEGIRALGAAHGQEGN